MPRVATSVANRPARTKQPSPAATNGHIAEDTALAVIASAEPSEPEEIVTIKVRPYDFGAKGSLYGFLDLQDAEFLLQDSIDSENPRGINAGIKALITAMRPYLVVTDEDFDLDAELRKLSFTNLFELAGAIRSGPPVPNANGAPLPNGSKATARRRRG